MTDITIAQAGTWPLYRQTLSRGADGTSTTLPAAGCFRMEIGPALEWTRRWRDALLEAGL